ncbi:unnamed protein product [Polarella glacialis]|uniref:Uncharacterized protein n=1 Tax=Polarella glacialis TaxID=89957 RepID=A0A813GY59_POLGL|nr:unnamed protein product [Polarella glacialis]
MSSSGSGGYCCLDFIELEAKEKAKGIRYKSFSDQVAKHLEDEGVKKKQAQEQDRNRAHWEHEEQLSKIKHSMGSLPKADGGLYWQNNIHYIPASIKFGDHGEVIVTGPPPPNAKVTKV